MRQHKLGGDLFSKFTFNDEKPLLVGFSAGPDSLCLLHLLKAQEFRVIAAHLDHGLRLSSGAEALRASAYCNEQGIPFRLRKADVAGYAVQNRISIEEAARKVRYAFLFEEAAKVGAQAVVVGHHADDQVETVRMHLLRGSGVGGLAGMRDILLPNPWSDTIPLIRPLLGVTREEIDAYCRLHNLIAVVDETNKDSQYFRNRIRQELIPQMISFNPEFKQRLLCLSEVVKEENGYLVSETGLAWQQVVIDQGDGFIVLDRNKFNALHNAIARRLLRKAVGELNRDLRDINFAAIDRALTLARTPNHANQVELQAGIDLLLHMREKLILISNTKPLDALWPQCATGCDAALTLPGETIINEYWSIFSNYCEEFDPSIEDLNIGQLDANVARDGLRLSTVKPGDRFQPQGMTQGTQKLGDFWTNNGLSKRAREHWPLVRAGKDIVWVPGFRIAHQARVKPETGKILKIELITKRRPGL